MQVRGLDKLTAFLRSRAEKALAESKDDVQIGFTAAYAIYVHEDLEARHQPPHGHGGQAKFLEQPAREQQEVLAATVRDALSGGASIPQALMLAGLQLQGMAQDLCPVDTGNLRASAYTKLVDRLEAELGAVAGVSPGGHSVTEV